MNHNLAFTMTAEPVLLLDGTVSVHDVRLTRCELTILRMLPHFDTITEIARALQRSERTVSFHLRSLMNKTHRRSLHRLLLWAAQRGLLSE